MSFSAPIPGRSSQRNMRRRLRHAPIAEINVTPFVDVMLVLLVIFMITAPLLSSGVPVNLPTSRASAIEQPDAMVSVTIDSTGQIYLDDVRISSSAFATKLVTIARTDREKNRQSQIMLYADRSLRYGTVMRIIGDVNRAGLTRIALVTTGEPQDN